MAELSHPAVVIGLGGTGKWALTYIKKNLLDTYGGVIPPTVKLLSFDTTAEKASRDGEAREEDVKVGDVQLDSNSEFVYLGGNIEQICRDIRDKQDYPHIGSWLQAETYLQATDSRAFDISGGASQKRPFGRMAVFYDLQQNVAAKLSNKILAAIDEVISANKQRSNVEIYIIASLAGGTGAGMFIDVAHLARWYAAKRIRTGYAIRGFLALHNTFNTVINTNQVQPQAFAAMRELDRFMLVFDQAYPIVYNPSTPDMRTIYGGKLGKLFDNCYLLDATREKMPLDGIHPKYGVYPSIADAINMLLDGSTGEAYTQHYVNVNNRIANVQSQLNKPIYSSLGAYSLILPVEDIITSLSYRFAQELLAKHFLNLSERPGEGGQVQYVLSYEGNARHEAAAFLQMPRSASGVASTGFIQGLPPRLDKRSPRDDGYISEVATLEASELLTWIIPPEGDPTVEELAKKVREDLEIQLANRVLPSNIEGDDPIEGCGRVIRGVRDFREEYLGHEVNGVKVGGRYQKALEKCVGIQRDRYRRLLSEHVVTLLNGSNPTNPDFQLEKQGQLGRVQALLSHLSVSYLSELVAFIERVKNRRAKGGELAESQENASLLRSDMEEKKTKGSFIGSFFKGLHPAVKAQQAFLEAEQDAIDAEVNDMFFDYIQQTARILQIETDNFKAAVDSWVNTLAQGITGTTTDPGLYRHLASLTQLHQTERNEKQTRFQSVREYVTDATYENSIYHSRTEGKFAEVLSQMIWGFEEQAGRIQLTLSNYDAVGSAPRSGRTATERNAIQLLQVSRRYFEPLRDTLTIADRLAEGDPLRLVRRLRDSCVPMVRFDNMKAGGEQDQTYFVCVREGNQRKFFDEVRTELRQFGTTARENQLLDSANPYTCTMLATADVFTSEGLHAYITAEREYNNFRNDARLLHNFPAEVHAVHLEQKLPSIKEERRRFSLVLTALLENIEDVQLFMRAYLYRAIRLDAVNTRDSCWRLHTAAIGRRGTSVFALTRTESEPQLLDAMETFLFRKADFTNETMTIDFPQLANELDQIEHDVSNGDWSRLINLLEDLIDQDLQPMRRSADQNMRDLGSIMQLLITDTIKGLHARLRNSGQTHNSNAEPLIDVRRRGTQTTAVVPQGPVLPGTSTGNSVPPSTGTLKEPTTSVSVETDTGNLAMLREFYNLYLEGDMTARGLLKKAGQVLETDDVGGLKEFYTMVQEGDMTEEGFVKRLARILGL